MCEYLVNDYALFCVLLCTYLYSECLLFILNIVCGHLINNYDLFCLICVCKRLIYEYC